MARNLQQQSHDLNAYDRPNQPWICGHACEGKTCALGPNRAGKCRDGAAECLPLRSGERWVCTRPETMGGPCEAGPGSEGACGCWLSACKPTRSQRSQRGRLTVALLLLSIGLIGIFLGVAPLTGHQFTSPGPLTAAHAVSSMSCEDCHAPVGEDTEFTRASVRERSLAMSEKCTSCHADFTGEAEANGLFAHGLHPDILQELAAEETERRQQANLLVTWASTSPSVEAGHTGQLACSTCHQEHQGRKADLAEFTNGQCQVCHQEQFRSFAHGHPEFTETGYPWKRRNRIYFDHGSHYGKHFSEDREHAPIGFREDAPFTESQSCATCHVPDEKGESMLVAGFEQSCAACHDDAVSGGEPIPFLTLPTLPGDSETWESVHAPISPLALAALSEEAYQVATRNARHDESGSLQLSAVEEPDFVASELKALFHEAWQNGPTALEQRLAENGWRLPDETEEASLFAGLSLDVTRQFFFPGHGYDVAELAFPALDLQTLNTHLAKDGRSVGAWPESASAPLSPLLRQLLSGSERAEAALQRFEELETVTLGDLRGAAPSILEEAAVLAWEIRELFHLMETRAESFLIGFVPFQGGLLSEGAAERALENAFYLARQDEAFMAIYHEQLLNYHRGSWPDAVPDAPEETPQPSPSTDDDDDFGSDDDFGAEDDFGSEPAMADDEFGAEDDFGSESADAPETEAEPGTLNLFEPSIVRDWHEQGGWYAENGSLNYLSTGHADPVLKQWLETTTRTASSGFSRAASDAATMLRFTMDLQQGVESNATGKCLKCHTVDIGLNDATGGLEWKINWFAGRGEPEEDWQLTRFHHESHTSSMRCDQCHRMNAEAEYSLAFPAKEFWTEWPGLPDPERAVDFESSFEPMLHQKDCASCHQPRQAGNNCLQCHDYHHRKVEMAGDH